MNIVNDYNGEKLELKKDPYFFCPEFSIHAFLYRKLNGCYLQTFSNVTDACSSIWYEYQRPFSGTLPGDSLTYFLWYILWYEVKVFVVSLLILFIIPGSILVDNFLVGHLFDIKVTKSRYCQIYLMLSVRLILESWYNKIILFDFSSYFQKNIIVLVYVIATHNLCYFI